MSLTAACTQISRMLGTLTEIRRVYGDPPESLNEFPCAIVYPSSGEMSVLSAGLNKSLHMVTIDIVQARQSLPVAVDLAKGWPEKVFALFAADLQLSGTVDAIVWPLTYRVLPMRYGVDVLFGVRFELKLKVM